MIEAAIDRLASLKIWAPPVVGFLKNPGTIAWLTGLQQETGRSVDETILLLLCAMRSLELTLLDGARDEDELLGFHRDHEVVVRDLCRTRRVQANVGERALPVLELLAHRWGRQRLFVTELGCSFGLIGRVLVSATQTLQGFDRYFAPNQQRPTEVPLVVGYRGIDLNPPDERWLLACIPLQPLRSRVARFLYEVPLDPQCDVVRGSAFDQNLWPIPEMGVVPVVLTSFMLYQLGEPLRRQLTDSIRDYARRYGGTWINLDVLVDNGNPRFVVQEDGEDRLELENDFCLSWKRHAG